MLASKHPESDLCLWQISHRQEIISGTCWWHTEWLNMCSQRFLLFTDGHILGTIFMWVCAKHSGLLYFCLFSCLLVFIFPQIFITDHYIFSKVGVFCWYFSVFFNQETNICCLPENQNVLNCSSADIYKFVNVFRNLNRNISYKVSHTRVIPLYAKGIIWYIQDQVGRDISWTCGKKVQLFQTPGKLHAPTSRNQLPFLWFIFFPTIYKAKFL